MPSNEAAWPSKTREMHNHHMDSTVWNALRFRDDDIVIATYGKSGTTWVQQIVAQLIFGGAEDVPVAAISPWLDVRLPPAAEKLAALEAQTHRRFIKTHLPVDALVYSPRAKYLAIGRDGRDVMWSWHNHFASANDAYYALLNDTPGRIGPAMPRPPADPRSWFLEWLENDGAPLWPFWEHVRSWWAIRGLPNCLLLHFAELKADLPGAIRRIAAFLDIPIDEARFPAIVRHCSFAWMRERGEAVVPMAGSLWEGGANSFLHRGVNGRWTDSLSAAECERYEARALAELGPDCAAWLRDGGVGGMRRVA